MNVDDAQEIIAYEDSNFDFENAPKVQCHLLEGVKIIAESLKGETIIHTDAASGAFYYGNFEKSVANLTEEQVRRLARLEWTMQHDMWLLFTNMA